MELIGKIKLKPWNLPKRITVNEVDIFDERKIANEFNAFFPKSGVNWQVKFQMLQQSSNPTLPLFIHRDLGTSQSVGKK